MLPVVQTADMSKVDLACCFLVCELCGAELSFSHVFEHADSHNRTKKKKATSIESDDANPKANKPNQNPLKGVQTSVMGRGRGEQVPLPLIIRSMMMSRKERSKRKRNFISQSSSPNHHVTTTPSSKSLGSPPPSSPLNDGKVTTLQGHVVHDESSSASVTTKVLNNCGDYDNDDDDDIVFIDHDHTGSGNFMDVKKCKPNQISNPPSASPWTPQRPAQSHIYTCPYTPTQTMTKSSKSSGQLDRK